LTDYKHGAYGALGDTVARASAAAETVPVHFGTAPVNLIRGWKTAQVVNRPLKIASKADGREKLGESSDWESYTLCESLAAHYDTSMEGIGPVYVVNVLDPDKHRSKEPSTAVLSFAAGTAYIESDTIILDSLSLSAGGGEGAQQTALSEGTDYSVSYDFASGRAILTSLDKEHPIDGEVCATFETVDPSKVTAQDVIGSATESAPAGIGAIGLVYQEHFAVPNLLAAPGWSDNPDVYRALVAAATKINGHWDAFVMADLPLSLSKSRNVDTIQAAIEWKSDSGYSSERSAVFWPQAVDSRGRAWHLSSLATAEAMRVDADNDGVPFAGWSNRTVPVVRQRFAEGSASVGFDQRAANQLNAHGITTAVGWAGEWVLWGPHTAAFCDGASYDQRAAFATGIRMLLYLTNAFQARWAPYIDGPMTRQLQDRILNSEQERLDALVAQGALVGSPQILFESSGNPDSALLSGDFLWEVAVTPVLPLKSATVRVSYTDEGLSSYLEGDE